MLAARTLTLKFPKFLKFGVDEYQSDDSFACGDYVGRDFYVRFHYHPGETFPSSSYRNYTR